MAQFPALPLFTDAYMADTRHLTAAQHGAYLLLLMTAWRMPNCSLPDDDNLLARWSCLGSNWLKHKEIIMGFWRKDAQGNYFQPRLSDERNHVALVREKNISAGRVSALKRKKRHSTDVPTEHQLEPQRKSNPLNPTLPSIPPIVPRGDFNAFWKMYPKKKSKGHAIKAYDKALKKVSHETIMAGLSKYVASNPGLYTQNASTWLNAMGWEDEHTPQQKKSLSPW